MIAIRPPTSPTTLIGGFSFAARAGTPTPISIILELSTGGGEFLPSVSSSSKSFCSPWITAIPVRRLIYDRTFFGYLNFFC